LDVNDGSRKETLKESIAVGEPTWEGGLGREWGGMRGRLTGMAIIELISKVVESDIEIVVSLSRCGG